MSPMRLFLRRLRPDAGDRTTARGTPAANSSWRSLIPIHASCVSGCPAPAHCTSAGKTQAIDPAAGVAEFDLTSQPATLPFLQLRADGDCQVRWAELV